MAAQIKKTTAILGRPRRDRPYMCVLGLRESSRSSNCTRLDQPLFATINTEKNALLTK